MVKKIDETEPIGKNRLAERAKDELGGYEEEVLAEVD